MENYIGLIKKLDMKDNFKMVNFMDLVLNMLLHSKFHKEKHKLIKLLLEFIKEVGLNMKEDLKMIKDKVQEKSILKTVNGVGISKTVSLTVMDYGKDQTVKN